MLKQGLGRLIRTASDRGILAVLDSRLVERRTGAASWTACPRHAWCTIWRRWEEFTEQAHAAS